MPLVGGDFSCNAILKDILFWFAPRGMGFLVQAAHLHHVRCVCPSLEGMILSPIVHICNRKSLPLVGGDVSVGYVFDISQTEFAPRGRGFLVELDAGRSKESVCPLWEGINHSNIKRQKLHKSLPLAGGDVFISVNL